MLNNPATPPGARIRGLRKSRGIAQAALAKKIGMRPGPLCNIERGKNYPSVPVLLRICEALGCTSNDLLGWPDAQCPRCRALRAALSEITAKAQEATDANH